MKNGMGDGDGFRYNTLMEKEHNQKEFYQKAMIFGRFVRFYRQHNGWSLENLGHTMHMSYSTIRRVELGETLLLPDEMDQIAQAFGFEGFLDNWHLLDAYATQMDDIRHFHLVDIERMLDKLDAFLCNPQLKASYFFAGYALLELYAMVYAKKGLMKTIWTKEERQALRAKVDEIDAFKDLFSNRQRAVYEQLAGDTWYECLRFEQAWTCYERALCFDKTSYLTHLRMADTAMILNCDQVARHHLARCQQLVFATASSEQFLQLALLEAIFLARNNEREAAQAALLNLYEEGVRTQNTFIQRQALDNLAQTAFFAQDDMNAIVFAKRSIEQFGDHVDFALYFYLLFSYLRLDDSHHVRRWSEWILRRETAPLVRYFVEGALAWSEGELEKADEALGIVYSEMALHQEPGWECFFLERLIDLNAQLGRVDRVETYHRRLLALERRKQKTRSIVGLREKD